MIVGFFGHSSIINSDMVKKELLLLIEAVIGEQGVDFWIGTHGAFDALSLSVAKDFQKAHPTARLVLVTPYLDSRAATEESAIYNEIIYPPIESVPKQFAILARNRYVARNADIIFAYVDRKLGGAAKALTEAKRAKKQIFNLAELKIHK